MRKRSLFDVGKWRSGLWVLKGDRCLVWGTGDRVLGDEGGDCCLMREIGDRVLGVEGRSLFDVI